MNVEASYPDHDRDVAVLECARAAKGWYNIQRSPSERLAVVGRAMAWAARANGGALPARTLTDFLRLLKTPVEEWLGGSGGPLVQEVGVLTEFALDIIDEAGGADAEAEVVQARVGGTQATFADRDNGDEEYRLFRRFLIEHATATVDEALDGLRAASLAPPDLFEEIPPSCHPVGPKAVCYPCPRCRWPMRFLDDIVQCASKVCQSEGARFLKNRGGLSAVGTMEPLESVQAAGRLRLRRAVWRYTLQPGLVELDLAARLERIPGVEVVLWPERDRYDLDVRAGEASWAVDVKDWSIAAKLAYYFHRHDPSERLFIVLPEWRRDHIAVLKDRCRHPNLHFYTVKQFVRTVRTKAQQTRGGREEGR